MRLSEKQRNEPPVKLTRAEKREIQAIIRKYKGDGKAHSAQASIPYQAMYPDGICKVTANTFSKCIEFADICRGGMLNGKDGPERRRSTAGCSGESMKRSRSRQNEKTLLQQNDTGGFP